MKENELRRGNFVVLVDSDIICQVYNISEVLGVLKFPDKNLLYQHTIEDLQPITLTPELLEKCGFLRIGKAMYQFRAFWFRFLDNQLKLLDDSKYPFYGSIPLTYIHQLQNLYFALTGEELSVSLDK